ncbi:MAG: RIP metalloprotease RseP [Xanthomonadales bacterium]|nr:RIP metalloprotease RseP [Xanthomonadales bacterium]
MNEFFGSVWWLLVTLGLLITFHEYGHYWVGRRFGVRVLRFSVGFGKPLWRRTDRHGTEFALAPIPLGGYVKFLDEREDDVPPALRDQAFNNKPVGQRMAIVAAGPAANLLFALLAFWAMYLVGKQDFAPVLGRAEGIAAQAGLRAGDRLTAIDGEPVATWTHAALRLVTAGVDRRAVAVEAESAHGERRSLVLDLSALPAGTREPAMLSASGLVPRHFVAPAVVGTVSDGSPAAEAGVLPGDRILAINETAVDDWSDVPRLVQAGGAQGELRLSVDRGGERLRLRLVPVEVEDEAGRRWQAGISVQRQAWEYDALLRHGPVGAAAAAARETWTLTGATVGMLWRMVAGRASLENISGPISISRYANASARSGLGHFLWFLGVISLSLCIINLLPVPILDGGHLLYYLIELVKGSPLSERAMAAGQYIGLVMLAGLMGLAFYNDILRLLS